MPVVAAGLRDVPDFPQPGVVFKDITPLLADPHAFATVIEAIARRGTTAPSTSSPASRPAASSSGRPWPTRWGRLRAGAQGRQAAGRHVSVSYDLEYGSAEIEVHADAFVGGERVLLVDDVLATGGTAAAAWDLLERTGAESSLRVHRRAAFLGGRARRWGPAGGSAPRRPMTRRLHSGHGGGHTTAAAGAHPAPAGCPRAARARRALALVGRNQVPENPVLEPLLQVVRSTHPKADLALIERAYAVAERAHEGQKRRSGDDYITHPLAVTTILAELGMTPTTLAAALLHDTVEDTAVQPRGAAPRLR